MAAPHKPDSRQNISAPEVKKHVAAEHQRELSNFTRALEAEFLSARGRETQSQHVYRQLALSTTDPAVLERALEVAVQNESYAEALEIAQYWHKLDPGNIPALFYLAHLSLREHHYIEAASALEQILAFDPTASLDRILTGIYPESKADRDALLMALNGLDIHRNPALLIMYAGLLVQDGQLERALVETERALLLKPHSSSILTLKTDILFAQQQPEEALRFLNRAIHKNPRDYDLRLYEIKSLVRLKKTEDALKAIELLGKKFDLDGETLLLAALLNIDTGRYPQAQSYLVQLLTYDEYVDRAYYYMSINSERMNEIDNAIIYLSKISSSDLFLKAQKRLVALRIANDQASEAVAHLTQVRAEHPDFSPELYSLQAQILHDMNEMEKARRVLDEALVSQPASMELLRQRLLVTDPKNHAEYLQLLARMLKLEPEQPELLGAYARLLLKTSLRVNEARTAVEQGLLYSPDNPDLLRLYGEILLGQRKWKDAVAPLTQLFEQTHTPEDGKKLYQALKYSHNIKEANTLLSLLEQMNIPSAQGAVSHRP